MQAVAANAWNIGSTVMNRSRPGTSSSACWMLRVLKKRLRCVSIAPFGRPVVPEV